MKDITVIICNWMQTRFTLGAVKNIRKYYPKIEVIVVDDGSHQEKKDDFNVAYARDAYNKDERFDNDIPSLLKASRDLDFRLVSNFTHMGHGSAIDYGVDIVETPLILTMDNDIRILGEGLVEEYLSKLDEDVYAVGTTYTEPVLDAKWIDPWFSLYRVEPIKQLHLTFSNFIFPKPGGSFHIGTGAFLHTMLTHDTLHRPKIWRAVHYPEPEMIDRLWHLKKFPTDQPGSRRYDMWEKWIDGGV